MKILITGTRGFVGGSLGRMAAQQAHQVLGLSRAAQPAPGWPGGYASTDVVSADLSPRIRDFNPDIIFHAAGTASVSASFNAPLDDLRASLLSWANLLDSVRRSERRPLVLFPSSGAVYGQPARLPVAETEEINPISPYGFHKAACELLAKEYANCFGLRIIVCRLFSLFGEQQRRLLIWELFQQFAGAQDVVWLQGTGEETRDYLYADDMAQAVLALAETKAGANGYQAINVASGVETGVLDLAHRIGSLVAPNKPIRCRGVHQSGDPERWRADVTQLQAAVPNWRPAPFAERLAKCITAWK